MGSEVEINNGIEKQIKKKVNNSIQNVSSLTDYHTLYEGMTLLKFCFSKKKIFLSLTLHK